MRANVYQWNIPAGNNFYWVAHHRCWRNCYGAGSVGSDNDQYFSWYPDSNAAVPNEDTIMEHAKDLCDICKWLHDKKGVLHTRLVGHSAEANICNFATHLIGESAWLGSEFRFAQLILLSPRFLSMKVRRRSSKSTTSMRSPLTTQLQEKQFFNFRPRTDSVLSGYGKRKHYDYPDIRNNADEGIRAVPDAQRDKVVPDMAAINHLEPCAVKTWDDEGLWDFVGCL